MYTSRPWFLLSTHPPHRLLTAILSVQIAKTLHEHISKYCQVVLDSLAYAGTGDVLKVQELLAICGEHIETEDNTAWKVGGYCWSLLVADTPGHTPWSSVCCYK